jgi:hypothetical protein
MEQNENWCLKPITTYIRHQLYHMIIWYYILNPYPEPWTLTPSGCRYGRISPKPLRVMVEYALTRSEALTFWIREHVTRYSLGELLSNKKYIESVRRPLYMRCLFYNERYINLACIMLNAGIKIHLNQLYIRIIYHSQSTKNLNQLSN